MDVLEELMEDARAIAKRSGGKVGGLPVNVATNKNGTNKRRSPGKKEIRQVNDEAVKRDIINFISVSDKPPTVIEVTDALTWARWPVVRLLKAMSEDGTIIRTGNRRTGYRHEINADRSEGVVK